MEGVGAAMPCRAAHAMQRLQGQLRSAERLRCLALVKPQPATVRTCCDVESKGEAEHQAGPQRAAGDGEACNGAGGWAWGWAEGWAEGWRAGSVVYCA